MGRFSKISEIFRTPLLFVFFFFVIADTIQRRYMVILMLVERDLPKGVDNLIAIFALETNKETNKNKTNKKGQ